MTSEQICQLGFRCPYHKYNNEGDGLCIYPNITITENEEDETFGFPEEMDCTLLEYDSPLDVWRMNYSEVNGRI